MEEEHVCSISELSGDRAIAPQGKALFEETIACQAIAPPAYSPTTQQVTMPQTKIVADAFSCSFAAKCSLSRGKHQLPAHIVRQSCP